MPAINKKDKIKRGLGSPNIDPETRRRIQSMGGKASHGGGRPRINGRSHHGSN